MSRRFDEGSYDRIELEEETRMELALISEIEPEINGIFECPRITEQVMQSLKEARADGVSIEDFFSEYLGNIQYCHCETGSCTWPLEHIVDALEDIQDLLEEYFSF